MTRRGATPRRRWPRLTIRWPALRIRPGVIRSAAVALSLIVALTVVVAGTRWLTPEDVVWTLEDDLLFQEGTDVDAVLAGFDESDTSFWRLSLNDIEVSLRELPWIDQVSVERQWPNRISVQVVEQTPLAFWNDDAFINSRGEVFGPSQLSFDLPSLSGPDGQAEEVMANYLRFSQMFSAMGHRVDELDLAARGTWRLTLDNGVEVRLGQRNILQRARRVARVLAATNNGQRADDIASLDARYQYGVAVAWKSGDAT